MDNLRKSIKETQKLKFGEKLRQDWYFESFFEKGLLAVSLCALLYSVIRIIMQGFW